MTFRVIKHWIFLTICIYSIQNVSAEFIPADACSPLLIAHRGASGYIPEHTLGAYALSITMGADYIEPDLVMTKDGHLIARHDNDLGLTTDVAQKPEFNSRLRNQTVDGVAVRGWFTEDFTLQEIKTLRAIERIPNLRPGNKRMDRAFEIPTLQEIIDLAKSMKTIYCKEVGIYPEIKHSSHFQRLGLAMEKPLVDTLHRNGYRGPNAPLYIQSFEISNLKALKNITDLRLLQLFGANQPYDQVLLGTNITYLSMATPEGLREVAKYAYAVGPEKTYIIPRTQNDTLGFPTRFVAFAHAAGLKVHVWTFRSENSFLPREYQSSVNPNDIGNAEGEIRDFLATGIDGLFTDQPDVLARIRQPCRTSNQCRSGSITLIPPFWFNVLCLSILFIVRI